MTTFPIWLSQSYPKSDGSNGFTYYESINSFDMTYFGETLIGGQIADPEQQTKSCISGVGTCHHGFLRMEQNADVGLKWGQIYSLNIQGLNTQENNCFISDVKFMQSTPVQEQANGYVAPTKLAAILQGDYKRTINQQDGVYLMIVDVADGNILLQNKLYSTSVEFQGSLSYSNNDNVYFAKQSQYSKLMIQKISVLTNIYQEITIGDSDNSNFLSLHASDVQVFSGNGIEMYYAAGLTKNIFNQFTNFVMFIKNGSVKWAYFDRSTVNSGFIIDKLVGKGDFKAYGTGTNYVNYNQRAQDGKIVISYVEFQYGSSCPPGFVREFDSGFGTDQIEVLSIYYEVYSLDTQFDNVFIMAYSHQQGYPALYQILYKPECTGAGTINVLPTINSFYNIYDYCSQTKPCSFTYGIYKKTWDYVNRSGWQNFAFYSGKHQQIQYDNTFIDSLPSDQYIHFIMSTEKSQQCFINTTPFVNNGVRTTGSLFTLTENTNYVSDYNVVTTQFQSSVTIPSYDVKFWDSTQSLQGWLFVEANIHGHVLQDKFPSCLCYSKNVYPTSPVQYGFSSSTTPYVQEYNSDGILNYVETSFETFYSNTFESNVGVSQPAACTDIISKTPIFLEISAFDTANNYGNLLELESDKMTTNMYWKAVSNPIDPDLSQVIGFTFKAYYLNFQTQTILKNEYYINSCRAFTYDGSYTLFEQTMFTGGFISVTGWSSFQYYSGVNSDIDCIPNQRQIISDDAPSQALIDANYLTISNSDTILFQTGSPEPFMCKFNIQASNSNGFTNMNKTPGSQEYLFEITYGCESPKYTFSYNGVLTWNLLLKSKTQGDFNIQSFDAIIVSPLEVPCTQGRVITNKIYGQPSLLDTSLSPEIVGQNSASMDFEVKTDYLGKYEFYIHNSLPSTNMFWSNSAPSGFLPQKFTVNVICGSETLSTPLGAIILTLINGNNQGQTIIQKFDVSSYTVSNYAIDGCDVNQFEVFQEDQEALQISNKMTIDNAGLLSVQTNVNNDVNCSIKATSKGGISIFVDVKLTMCGGTEKNGGETVVVPIGWVDTFKVFNLNPAQIILPIFVSDNIKCPITEVSISNSNLNKISSYPSGLIKSYDETNRLIELQTANLGNQTFNVKVKTKGENFFHFPFNVTIICGAEQIEANEPNKMELNFTYLSGNQTIDMKEFLQYFNQPVCPIEGFIVSNITFEDGKAFDDKFKIVEIKDNFTLVIQTNLLKAPTLQIYFKPYSNYTLFAQNQEVMLVTFNITDPIKVKADVNSTQIDSIVIQKNEPPRFETDSFKLEYLVVPNVTVDNSLEKQLQTTSISLPKIIDSQANLKQIKVIFEENLANLATYDEEKHVILLNNSLASDRNIGTFQINVILQDKQGQDNVYLINIDIIDEEMAKKLKLPGYAEYDGTQQNDDDSNLDGMLFAQLLKERQEKNKNKNKSNLNEEKDGRLSAKIKSVSNKGKVIIEFSKQIKPSRRLQATESFNLTNIDNDVLNLTIIPNFNQLNLSLLDFTWECTNFTETELIIILQFENSLYVSHEGTDVLSIEILNDTIFETKDSQINETLSQGYKMQKDLVSQLPNNTATRILIDSTSHLKQTLDSAVTVSIIGNIALASSMHVIWGLINTLQMILYLPMANLQFPSNVRYFFSQLLPLSSLDIIPPEYSTDLIFKFSLDKDKPFSQTLLQMGYETHNAILNLGTLFYLIGLNIFMLIIQVILIQLIQKNKKIYISRKSLFGKMYHKLISQSLVNSLVVLLLEGYQEILISSYLNIIEPQDITFGDQFSVAMSIVGMIISLIILPIVFLSIVFVNQKKLFKIKFKINYGGVYEGLKFWYKSALMYNFIYIIRRMVFLTIMFNQSFIEHNIFQIQGILFLNLFCGMYVTYIRPFTKRIKNNLENFNEYFIYDCCIQLMIFTNWVDDVQIQSDLGFVLIGMTILVVFINLAIIIWNTFSSAFKSCYKKLTEAPSKSKVIIVDNQVNIINPQTGVIEQIENQPLEFSKKRIQQFDLIKNPKQLKPTMQTIQEASVESSQSSVILAGDGPLKKVQTVQRIVGGHQFYDSYLDITDDKNIVGGSAGNTARSENDIIEPYLQRDISHLTMQINRMVKAKNNAITDYIYSDLMQPTWKLEKKYKGVIQPSDLQKLAKLKQNILIGREVSKTQENNVRHSIDSHIQLLRDKVEVLETQLQEKEQQSNLQQRGVIAERIQKQMRQKLFKVNSDIMGLNVPIKNRKMSSIKQGPNISIKKKMDRSISRLDTIDPPEDDEEESYSIFEVRKSRINDIQKQNFQ